MQALAGEFPVPADSRFYRPQLVHLTHRPLLDLGQEREAVELHANYTAAWRTFGWMPEVFHLDLSKVRSSLLVPQSLLFFHPHLCIPPVPAP